MLVVWKEFFETVNIVLLLLSELGVCTCIVTSYRSHDVYGVDDMAKENSFSIGIRL